MEFAVQDGSFQSSQSRELWSADLGSFLGHHPQQVRRSHYRDGYQLAADPVCAEAQFLNLRKSGVNLRRRLAITGVAVGFYAQLQRSGGIYESHVASDWSHFLVWRVGLRSDP